jgi:hypothetical protein
VSRILIIAVPAGKLDDDGTARLRALIVPQLDADANDERPLSDFGFQNWPATINEASSTFVARFAPDTAAIPVSKVVTLVPHASTDVWNGFFSRTTVRPPRFAAYDRLYVSPTSADAQTIVGGYTATAGMHTGDDPTAADKAAAAAREQYGQWTQPPDIPPPPDDFGKPTLADDSQVWAAPDFQRTVSMLREHPTVLLQLGLILEFTLSGADVPKTPGQGWHLISIGSDLDTRVPPAVRIVAPWTKFHFENSRFLPWSAPESDVTFGIVDLAGATKISAKRESVAGRWSFATFDVAGAVSRLREGAQRQATSGTAPDTLPVLHSSGLTLLRNGREEQLRHRVANSQRAQANRSGTPVHSSGTDIADQLLTADDLTLGYRVDIKQQAGSWTSLCERAATYFLDGDPIGSVAHHEESQVKANAAAVEKDNVLRADEAVVRWYGWNLAFRRPQFDQLGAREPDERPVDLSFNFSWKFEQVPLTKQTPLRFGHGYHMRIRVADMAGSGLKAADLHDANAGQSDLLLYQRHEPVPPPEFAPPATSSVPNPAGPFGLGGSVDRVVIRSDPAGDTPMDADQFNAAHPGKYSANNARTVLPPPTSMTLAEQYGALDGADVNTWGWVQRAMSAPAADTEGHYTWLPDPAALQVQVFVTKHADSPAPGRKLADEWGPRWPDLEPKRLELRGRMPGEDVVEWGDGEHEPLGTFIARLDAGLRVDVELSSTIRVGDIDKFEVKNWADGGAEALIPEGRHPMATPPRVVELVHAVRRPINPPDSSLAVWRKAAAQFAVLMDGGPSGPVARGLFGIHRPSTGQVDVRAEWHEPVDSAAPGPLITEEVTSLTVGSSDAVIADGDPMPSADDGTLTVSAFRHDFGDTRHRMVTYTLTAVSRYRDYFIDGADEAVKARFKSGKKLAPVSIPSSARPAPPVVLSVSPAFTKSVVSDGSTQVQRIRRGKTVRVELARPWNVSGDGEQLAVVIAADTSDQYLRKTGRYLSRIYRDPIWRASDIGGYLQRDAFLDSAGPVTLRLDDVNASAVAIPFPVSFSNETDRWWADVEIPMFNSEILLPESDRPYSPFVRLAVARYQPESVTDCELSRIVMTDFVSLMPDRTLLVDSSSDGDDVEVTLQLIGPEPKGARPNKVVAMLENCALPAGADRALSDVTSANSSHTGLWHRKETPVIGSLNTPLAPIGYQRGGDAYRIVVREYEDIESPVPAAPAGTFAADLQQRTVFLDVVPLD